VPTNTGLAALEAPRPGRASLAEVLWRARRSHAAKTSHLPIAPLLRVAGAGANGATSSTGDGPVYKRGDGWQYGQDEPEGAK